MDNKPRALTIFLLFILLGSFYKNSMAQTEDSPKHPLTFFATIFSIDPAEGILKVSDENGKMYTLLIDDTSLITGPGVAEIDLYNLHKGGGVQVIAVKQETGSLRVEKLDVLAPPKIMVKEPRPGMVVESLPIRVKGSVYKGKPLTFRVYALDRSGERVVIIRTDTIEPKDTQDTNVYKPFEKEIDFTPAEIEIISSTTLTLEIAHKKESVRRTIIPAFIRSVELCFANKIRDPQAMKPHVIYRVQRNSLNTITPREIVQLLFKGPTEQEKINGYHSLIPDDAMLNSIKIENGVAYADFANLNVGGSTRVTAIRAQIEQTLKANLDVSSVIISVDGSVESALQP